MVNNRTKEKKIFAYFGIFFLFFILLQHHCCFPGWLLLNRGKFFYTVHIKIRKQEKLSGLLEEYKTFSLYGKAENQIFAPIFNIMRNI